MTRRWTAAMAEPPSTSPCGSTASTSPCARRRASLNADTRLEGPPDVSAVDRNDDEQSWRRHLQLHAPNPSPSRTVLTLEPVASHAIGWRVVAWQNRHAGPCGRRPTPKLDGSLQPARKPTPPQQPDQTEPTPLLGPPKRQTKPTQAPEALMSILGSGAVVEHDARSR